MKLYFTFFVVLLVMVQSAFEPLRAQSPPWKKDTRNPVLSGGDSGSWNRHVFWPTVLHNADSARYEMWFPASPGPQQGIWRPMRIGFATSPDGIAWTKHPTPVMEPDSGSWDEYTVEGLTVIRENGSYRMWYTSWSTSDAGGIGYATSPDGINWTKYAGNPLIVPASAWEAGGYGICHVLKVQGEYKIYYGGYTADFQYANIGYATSPDGITWTPDTVNNPVLTRGTGVRWDGGVVDRPHLLFINDVYHMWYVGTPPFEATPWQIGWATSADGIHWDKYNDPSTASVLYLDSDPVLKPGPSWEWDHSYVQPGSVIHEGDSLRMWYSGSRIDVTVSLWRIGHATVAFDSSVVGLFNDFDRSNVPQEYVLFQNSPNPFNPATTIRYQLPKPELVTLKIYDVLGREVAVLVNEFQSAGVQTVVWDGRNHYGNVVSSGIYLYQLQAGEYAQSRKMLLVQ